MDRRVLFAILLCFSVVYLWQALYVRPRMKPVAAPSAASPGGTAPTEAGAVAAAQAAAPPAAPPPASAPALVGDQVEREVRVETPEIVALFTNRGGRVKSWRLKKYLDAKKEPLELVATDLAPPQPLPFTLEVPDAAETATLNGALYTVAGAPDPAAPASTATDLTFTYRDTAGLSVVKAFHIDPTSYLITFRATVSAGGQPQTPTIDWGPAFPAIESGRFAVKPGAILSVDGSKEQRITAANILKQPTYEDTFKYVGVEDHYFLSVAFAPGRAKVSYRPLSIPIPAGTKLPARDLMAYSIQPATPDQTLKFYIGPKDFNELASVDREFVRAINFGFFSVIVVPLLRSLNWIYGYTGNYGWSIVLLTVIINLIIFPLRHKSVVSMRKMQEIQPEVKEIQDRYAKLKTTDPAKQKMNTEMMELYRKRGVNPASGCVPMLLPFPILLAFYSLLTTAIELRGAPFTLWIHDLSTPDPYYVTPILMGASQLWQQWIMPAAGMDPAQRKMTMIMPVVFMFLFISYPSGIAIYWLSSTLWGIGQQYFTNYWIGPPTIRNVRAAGERRRRVGAGKTEAAAREE